MDPSTAPGLPEETYEVEEGILVERIAAICPRCGLRFEARVAAADLEDPEHEDLDFCPSGDGIAARERRLVSCPACALCLMPELFRDQPSSEDAAALQSIDFTSLEDPARPWLAFERAALALEKLGFQAGERALTLLEGAWSARQHGDLEGDLAMLARSLDLFREAFAQGSFNEGVLPAMHVIAAEASRRLGLFAEAHRHLSAFADLDARGKALYNADDLRERAEAIRAAVAARDVAARRAP